MITINNNITKTVNSLSLYKQLYYKYILPYLFIRIHKDLLS